MDRKIDLTGKENSAEESYDAVFVTFIEIYNTMLMNG